MKPSTASKPRVLVAGGGLAGMVSALRLAELGCAVELVEADHRLGGRAGSDLVDGRYEDHSYHIAFPWYENFLRLTTEIDVRRDFIASPAYHQLVAGQFPRYRPYRTVGSLIDWTRSLSRGVLPIPDGLLYFYLMVDAINQAARLLEQPDISVEEFVRTRWYATTAVQDELDRIFVTGHGTSTARFSLHTWLRFLPAFARCRAAMYWIPRRSLEETLIGPLAGALHEHGISIRTGWRVEQVDASDGQVSAVHLATPDGPVTRQAEQLVLSLPLDVLSELKGDAIDQADLDRDRLRALVTRPVAALHLYFRTKVAELPTEHVALVNSRFDLSFIDVSGTREGIHGSCLNVVAGRPGRLLDWPEERVVATVVEELATFVPGLRVEDVTHHVWRPNVENPLLSNEVGSWSHRPSTRTALRNLFLAGDYVRSFVDVASMEGAVVTGLLAADAVREATGLADEPVEVHRLPATPQPVSAAMRALLAPAAMVAYFLSTSRDATGHRRVR